MEFERNVVSRRFIISWMRGEFNWFGMWDSGEVMQKFHEAENDLTSAAWLLNRDELFVGTLDGRILLINTDTGEESELFSGHFGPVSSLALSIDGKYLASSSHDGSILIWDVTKFLD